MVTLTTKLKDSEIEKIIDKVQKVCKSDPNLSPRTRSELITAYKDRRLLVAMSNSSPVGWILRLPYANESQELAAAYVVESFRSRGIFAKLLQAAIKEAKTSILVTFNKQLAHYLVSKQAFKQSSLWQAVRISKGRFLLDRLNVERFLAIAKHFVRNNPTYLILSKNE